MKLMHLITNKWPVDKKDRHYIRLLPRESPRKECLRHLKYKILHSPIRPILAWFFKRYWEVKNARVHKHNSTPGLVTNKCIQCYGLFFRSLAKPHVPELCPKCYNKIRGL